MNRETRTGATRAKAPTDYAELLGVIIAVPAP
jgi:hypothetical protein